MINNPNNKNPRVGTSLVAAAIYRIWRYPDPEIIKLLYRLPPYVNVVYRRPLGTSNKEPKIAIILVSGRRHDNCFGAFKDTGMTVEQLSKAKTTQGFVDAFGNYYTKYEALDLVIKNPKANRIKAEKLAELERRLHNKGSRAELFSEDLW